MFTCVPAEYIYQLNQYLIRIISSTSIQSCVGQLLDRSEWFSLAHQELQPTFGAEQFFQCPSLLTLNAPASDASCVTANSATSTSTSTSSSCITCPECCPPTAANVHSSATETTTTSANEMTSSTTTANTSRRRVVHPVLCAGRREMLEQMQCVKEGAAPTPMWRLLGRIVQRFGLALGLGLERLFQRAEDADADERDCRALHSALFESDASASSTSANSSVNALPLSSAGDVGLSSAPASSSNNACARNEECERVPRQYMTLCKRTAFTGNASLLLGGTFSSPVDVCKFQWVLNLIR